MSFLRFGDWRLPVVRVTILAAANTTKLAVSIVFTVTDPPV